MRKLLTSVVALSLTGSLLAGGLVTNTNQSAMFTRLQNRNASTNIDAVYYNPAGLTKLANGFFASINNQTINQTQTITSDYYFLSGTKPREYTGKVKAPVYPGIYVAYKTGKIVFSGGFNVIGGGGGAKYDMGLPSFEMQVADLVPGLSQKLYPLDTTINYYYGTDPGFRNITGYSSEIFFEGKSVYKGYQANVSYEINDMLSVAVGGRLVSAKNTYNGYIQGVEITAPANYGGSQTPGDYLRLIAGLPGMPPTTATDLTNSALYLDDATTVEADAEMKGTGFTPILSLNFTPSETFNVAIRYEFKTILNLKTIVHEGKDAEGMFIQDSVAIADIPAFLAIGANFRPMEKLMLSGSLNYYFDKKVDFDGESDLDENQIDKNFIEFGLGAEYSLSEKLRISGGWVHTIPGVNSIYQKDMNYELVTNSFGCGFGYRIAPMIDLNIGGQYTSYQEAAKTYTHLVPVKETYDKSTWLVAAGLDFYFGK
jgi:long-chain fatty acid transport protein